MKQVLIATPCLDQKVDAYFVHSLCESIKLGIKHNYDIRCVFLANESILPMARTIEEIRGTISAARDSVWVVEDFISKIAGGQTPNEELKGNIERNVAHLKLVTSNQ